MGLAAPARAQEVVTEEQFLAGFDDQHVAVRALQEGTAAAEAARVSAGRLANPRLEWWRESPEASPRVTNWTVAWTPPLDGRRGLGKQAAQAGVEAATQRLASERARLRRELRGAFAEWALATQRRGVCWPASSRWWRGWPRPSGNGPGWVNPRAWPPGASTLAAAEARAALRQAEAEQARAEARARGWRPDLTAGATGALPGLPDPPLELTSAEAPELRALALDVERLDLEARRAGRSWGFPTLQAGWQRLDDRRGLVQDGAIFAASWSVPLFDRDQAAGSRPRSAVWLWRLGSSCTRSRLAAELQGDLAAYRSWLVSAGEARQSAEEGERVVEAAGAAYRAGEFTLTDLLDTVRAAFATRLRALEVHGRALEVHRELEAAAGRPLSGGGR